MKQRDVAMMMLLVLVVCAALLYLDWRRQGEIELLHERIDSLDAAAAQALATLYPADREPSPVERILYASDDRTLSDIAKEGAR